MKKLLFELIRTSFFISAILAFSIFVGVAINELWNNNYAPIFPAIVNMETLLSIFNVVGAAALITMPVVLFGMAARTYSKRQSVKDGEDVVKISSMFALMLVVIPTGLLIFQERWEVLGCFAIYWIVVVVLGNLGKYAPYQPAFVSCLERTTNRMGMPK